MTVGDLQAILAYYPKEVDVEIRMIRFGKPIDLPIEKVDQVAEDNCLYLINEHGLKE